MNTHQSVGKNFANWNPKFANWIQLAKVCQLDLVLEQRLRTNPFQLAVGKPIFLPTELSDCCNSIFAPISVGENSPSYYVGEGIHIPSPLRKEVVSGLRVSEVVGGRSILAIDLGTTTGWALRLVMEG